MCAVIFGGVATRSLRGQGQNAAANPATPDEFQQAVMPVLAKNCVGCHSDRLHSGNLSLEQFREPTAALGKPDVWQKVLDKVTAGQMPPKPAAPLAGADLAAVTGWIRKLPGVSETSASAGPVNPGRVTARRLNRTEYNNTIRDLLGVAARPADEFPVDDSGYGFDNNSDVLSVSPLLMEKYLQAAKTVSKLAVYGETLPPKPGLIVRLLNRRSQDNYDVLNGGNQGVWLPYSLRGAMYGKYIFPVDGEYEFRLRIANFRAAEENPDVPNGVGGAPARGAGRGAPGAPGARGGGGGRGRGAGFVRRDPTPEELKARDEAARKAAPPRKLILAVDGTPIISTVIEGNGSFGYSQGEFTTRVAVKAGERFLRASYPELANLDDPRENINKDMRRGLFVDYLDIVGPFNPSTAPPASYTKIFICSATTPQCAKTILTNLMERAYRRPVTDLEVAAKLRLVTLAQRQGDKFQEGIRLALQAILASPDFLFRVESDPKPTAGLGQQDTGYVRAASPATTASAHPVTDIELASRLSYFLWASMPDDELMRAAKAQTLRKPGVLEAQVRRMLADPRAHNLVDNWAAQWLQLRNLGRTKPDPVRFPTVDDELLDAMRTETSMFMEAIIKEDRSILDIIDGPFTFVNGPLARHYGIKGVDGEEFQRVTLDPEQRGGVLTQAAILTVSSYPTRTSPPVRGKWVLENLLGTPPPPPPPDVPAFKDSDIGTEVSMRERLAEHRKNPSCSPCHNLMDPIGFGLENYDAVGAWRTQDGKFPVETTGALPGGATFTGSKGLKGILKEQSETFAHNVTEKLLTYSLGRGLEQFDAPTVDGIVKNIAASNYKFSALVMEVVRSAPFQMRSADIARPEVMRSAERSVMEGGKP